MESNTVSDGKVVILKEYGNGYNGKHDGWAYQFLNDNYEGIHLGVCCKDFLQDIVYSELTNKSISVYGQTSVNTNTFEKQERLLLCMYPHSFITKEKPNLELFSENLEIFLNEIEVLRGYDLSLVYVVDDKIIIDFSKEWICNPPTFSVFTLFCRVGIYYDSGNIEEYVSTLFQQRKPYLDRCDIYYFENGNLLYILLFIHNKLKFTGKSWENLISPGDVHNSGFFSNTKFLKYDYEKEKTNNTI